MDPYIVEPLGVGYLASVLKKSGFEVDWFKVDNNLISEIKKYKPKILAYSVTTGQHSKFVKLNNQIKKEYDTLSIFGGSHPTYYPNFSNTPGVDVIIRGEAEKSFVELLDDIQVKHKCHSTVEFKKLEQNLDRIPFPDREFLYKYPENRNNPIKNVITSRGCPYSCRFCYNSILRDLYKGQNWLRHRSPENVVKECLELKKYPLKLIYFEDDEFLHNPKIDDLLALYKKEVKVPFHCQIRIEFLTEERAKQLKDSGCVSVTFAAESGNDYIRKEILGKNTPREKIIKGSEILHKVGLKFRIENIVGIPGENLNQMLETLDLNIQCNPQYAWASIFSPFPNLPISDYAIKNGFWDGKVNDIKETFFEDTVLNTSIRKEIVNMQRLFAIFVSFPFLRRFVSKLLKIPNNKLFNKLYFWWKKKCFNKLYEV